MAYRRYLISPNHDYTPDTEFNNRMRPRQFEEHKKKTTEREIAKLMASKEYNDYLARKRQGTRMVKEDSDDEIVFSDE